MIRYISVIILMVLCSCQGNKLKPREYAIYVKEHTNQLHKKVDAGALEYSLQYKPLEFIVANEFKKEEISQKDLEIRKEDLKGLQYYSLRMKSNVGGDVMKIGTNSNDQYFDKINYYSYDFKNDIRLIEGSDTLSCKLFHFVRSHGTAPYVDFIFAFEDKKNDDNKEIYIYDKATLQDVVYFEIKDKDIKLIPQLLAY